MIQFKKRFIQISSVITILTAALFSITVGCAAEPIMTTVINPPRYQAGWQYSRSASGFSVKIPITETISIQPVFSFGMTQNPGSQGTTNANGHFALGLRGVHNLPARGNFQPYAGIGWGHSENFSGPTLATAKITKGNTGFETFIGAEYQKYIIQPSLEMGLGSYTKADGSYYAGITFNFALMYTF